MSKARLFSPASLRLFLDCPRCFWLEKKRSVRRPRGFFPSISAGLDFTIKTYFDDYRRKHILPPQIDGKVGGKLLDDTQMG
ncbi:hypothetical protein ACFL38_04990 [Candidatus Omnitrophota bacterium]